MLIADNQWLILELYLNWTSYLLEEKGMGMIF